ncbi:PEP-CTERM sorting domain-containing protein [Colwellia sp. D2M02]|uniref:PEP-CTERM sorting domain-containing protein n=1 Tax=Colwellia sp. D2M02 TaxID=2841562 RepID=UPI001C0A08FE|nr:PEP-CTERM sorting domain-containing protein [Colwellia sp. D2M02]MBU2895045.1 PEP-CTERM sorting domain-containing protein [Colwellia sp. D2M02]
MMLRNLFAAVLLLTLAATAKATPIKSGIDGSFDIFSVADITLNADGEVTLINFIFANIALVDQAGDYAPYLTAGDAVALDTNPISINNIIGLQLWNVNGFSFIATAIGANETVGATTGLYIIGDVVHDDFITTSTEFFLSSQNLTVDGTKQSALSASITSPAPVAVSEPGSLAILALGLIGFAASRKKKSA